MTVLTTSRAELVAALEKDEVTLFLISDDADSHAEAVHDKAESVAKDWQFVFLITDLGILKPAERKLWLKDPSHYAVIGGTNKVVGVRGPLSDLIGPKGDPSGIEIRWAFAQGDRLP